MALNPHSESPDVVLPAEYKAEHPGDDPRMWGWHGEWGRASRIAGWITVAILLVMITATHYNDSGTLWLIVFAAALVVGLLWDAYRRKNAWRR